MSALRVFLADDHNVVLEGLKFLVQAQPDMAVIGQAVDGNAAVADAIAMRPDVAVIDISLPGMNGIDVMRCLATELPDTRVLALTVHEDKGYVRRAFEAGASGYVLKRAASLELITAIRAVASGQTYLDPGLSETRPADADPSVFGAPGMLSEREEEVMRLIAKGFSNKEVARQLSLSIKTVETYKARSLEKLGLKGRVDIIRFAAANGWLDSLSGG